MSEQIVSEKKPVDVAEIVIETKTEVAQPETQEAKPKPERRRRQNRRKSDASGDKKSSDGEKSNSKSRDNQMIIAKKPIGTYVYVLKKLLDKYDQIDLTAGFGNANSKVIWIANRMVHWGYCTISKIKTNVPSQLEV